MKYHRRNASCGLQNARMRGDAEVCIKNESHRIPAPDLTHIECGVIREDRPDADHDRVALRAKPVRAAAGLRPRDPA